MFRFSRFVVAAAAVSAAAFSPVSAWGDPGTACGDNMVMNTHGECVAVGSVCTLSDGMVIGMIARDGRCVLPGMNT